MTPQMRVPLLDLRAQYAPLRARIEQAIREVCDSQQFVLGPRVGRAHVVSDWPGLAQSVLFEGRDLKPTVDTRAVLKAALAGTFDVTSAQLDRVFPNSSTVRPSAGLMT